MIGGAHETVERVRQLFNSVAFLEVFAQCEANGGEIVLTLDMKMQGLALGLQNQSALYPMPYDLWSQRSARSKEHVRC